MTQPALRLVAIPLTAILMSARGLLAAECLEPEAPELPNGKTASMDAMLAGQKAVKAFQDLNLAYRDCLENEVSEAKATMEEAAEEGDKEAATAALAQHDAAIEAFNDAVADEEALAGQFNTEIREFKAAQQ